MTTQQIISCDKGSYTCSPPKSCCTEGCCFLKTSLYTPANIQTNVINPLFIGHWYFWLAVTATVTGILCACTLWRKHSQGNLCCGDSGRDDRASEPDSNGSCYAPPQYSRCNSFYQAPPPYSEVTSKPDRYPVVINYDLEPAVKNNSSTGYLMVQYFRKLIVGPVADRSLSATSTNDSINSSFLCNVAIEANTIVPPPYSSTGSLDELANDKQWKPSDPAALILTQLDSSGAAPTTTTTTTTTSSSSVASALTIEKEDSASAMVPVGQDKNPNKDNPLPDHHMPLPNDYDYASNNHAKLVPNIDRLVNRNQNSSRKLLKERSSDSESQDEGNNFSDLLNLSVCVPSSKIPIHSNPLLQELHYSVANSMTGSEVSSLANLDTLDSPPRATSPTLEMKELLQKIQKLPQQDQARPSRNYFHKIRAKTLYMPLTNHYGNKTKQLPNVSSSSSKSWLSRSAPNTPSTNYAPIFPIHMAAIPTKQKITDGSPLLDETDDTEVEEETMSHQDEHL